MKVLHIINSLETGGAEKLIIDTLPLLKAKGIELELLVLKKTNAIFEQKFLQEQHIPCHFLGEASVYSPMHIFKIIPYLKNYDLVHVHLFPCLYWVALAKFLSRSKTKLVFTEHSTQNRRMKNVFFYPIDRFIYAKYQKIISISKKVDEYIKKSLNVGPAKFQLICNGIDLKAIKLARPISKEQLTQKKNENRTIILQVSAFRVPKNQNILIKALQYLPEDYIAIFVGDGPMINESKQLTADLNLSHRVVFLGLRTDVPSLLKTADVVVLSSHYEGLSLASIEGMASGKPFVASNVPGLTEVVQNAGVLFEDNNHEQLASEIQKLMNDEVWYKNVAQKCYERAQTYDIKHMIDQTVDLYKNIIQSHAQA
jgi:glycosyltransferase involved in cell wall biosynthesis